VASAAVAFCVGTLVLALIVNAYGEHDNDWAYRSCFVTQYGVTGLAMLAWPWMPESPAWCMSHGKERQALSASKKLGMSDEETTKTVAQIQYTLHKFATETAGVTYAELFRKSNLRRTMVVCMPLSIQPVTGVLWVAGYFLYYTQLAGFSTSMSYKLNITQQVLSTTGNVTSVSLTREK
jgi:SP family general alpha glucoside:H+ symporter-like MFS transporter